MIACRNSRNWTEILIDATYRLRATRANPLQDPGPEHGGRRAGDRIGRIVSLSCEGTELRATWRQRYWGPNWVCDCTGEGSMTVGPAGGLLDGFIDTKSVDWDLTPILGFDIAREGGSYSFACSAREGEPGFPLTCTCTDSGTWTGEAKFATSQ